MENILDELKKDKNAAIAVLKSKGKDRGKIDQIISEFYKNERDIRDAQVGNVQKDKMVKTESGTKNVPQVKLSIPFQKKIVTNSTAFEVGKPVTLTANTDNKKSKLPDLVKKLWVSNRIDHLIQKLVYLKKAQTEGALLFYISDIKESSFIKKAFTKLGFTDVKKQIKVKLLDNRKGSMFPYFDDLGDMKAFVWEFKVTNKEKSVTHTWIYDKTNVYKTNSENDEVKKEPHGFDRIPIDYVDQENTEWHDAISLIDRIEVTLSKLCGSNDYTAHPMVKIFGDVQNAPEKDEDGKAWMIPIKFDDDGNEIKGDVELITNPNSSDSVKLELDKLEDLIYGLTSTVNLSFNNVKGLGNISGVALTLMFLDSNIKASLNEGDNRTMIERIINILIGGITTTTNTKLASEASDLFYDIQFNSILPTDLKEAVETVSQAVTSGVMSKRTAVEYLDMNQNTEEELELINNETKQQNEDPTKTN
ncbi:MULTISPECIES: phage portal protein [unclassified Myroides]|uniref:phage portal protein n=1 Tax=unclassified Myroides TaxID=2642485 RepID=UPI003D2F757E